MLRAPVLSRPERRWERVQARAGLQAQPEPLPALLPQAFQPRSARPPSQARDAKHPPRGRPGRMRWLWDLLRTQRCAAAVPWVAAWQP